MKWYILLNNQNTSGCRFCNVTKIAAKLNKWHFHNKWSHKYQINTHYLFNNLVLQYLIFVKNIFYSFKNNQCYYCEHPNNFSWCTSGLRQQFAGLWLVLPDSNRILKNHLLRNPLWYIQNRILRNLQKVRR